MNRHAPPPGPFADNLRLVMERRGRLSGEVARRLGVSKKKVQRFQSGETRPRLEDVLRLSAILVVDPALLAWCPTADLAQRLATHPHGETHA